jgi:hypothetical protein
VAVCAASVGRTAIASLWLLITGQEKKIDRDGPLTCAAGSSEEVINSPEGAKISEDLSQQQTTAKEQPEEKKEDFPISISAGCWNNSTDATKVSRKLVAASAPGYHRRKCLESLQQ